MNPIPIHWMALIIVAAFFGGYAAGVRYEKRAEEAREAKIALTASQEANTRATKTTDLLGTLLARPELAADSVVLDRLCVEPAHSIGVPKPANGPRPSSPAAAPAPRTDPRLARELKTCVRLADEWDVLVKMWHANEAAVAKSLPASTSESAQ